MVSPCSFPYSKKQLFWFFYLMTLAFVGLYTIGLKHHRPKAQQYCNCPVSRLKRASLIAQLVNYLPAMQDTRVWFLGQEDPLEKEMATHSGILAWRIPWTEEPGGLQSMGLQRVGHNWVTNTFQYSVMTFCISVVLAVISTLSFFILFIWFSFFFSWWAWLKVYQFFLIFFFF